MKELVDWLTKKMEWSYKTFGTAERYIGVLKHIEKEIEEVRQNPQDISEWVDIIILAFDGACRMGFTPEQVVNALITKQEQNINRSWPPPPKDDEPSFHLKKEPKYKIIKNKAQCKKCGDIIESKYRHDFVSCKCGSIFVDGGLDYCRSGADNFENFIDLSEVNWL
jgi:hypothetical protein